MTKVQLKRLEKILYVLATLFSLAAIIMMVCTAVVPTEITGVKQKVDAGFYGYDITFGLKDGDIYGLKFSVLALLPYVFVVAGIVLLVFRIIDKFISRKFDFMIAGIFLLSALLYFLSNNFLVFSENLVGELYNSFEYQISYGLIISGACSVIAGGLAASSYILEEFVTTKDVSEKEKNSTETEIVEKQNEVKEEQTEKKSKKESEDKQESESLTQKEDAEK